MVEKMEPFRETFSKDVTSSHLQTEMDTHGYVLIRGLLPTDYIAGLLKEILQIVREAGWLLSGPGDLSRTANLSAACGDSDEAFNPVYDKVFSLEMLHALPHHPALRKIMSLLVGDCLLVHPKPISRLIFPNCERFMIKAHQDHQSIGGDAGSFTVWMPLHDCPIESGPLQILEASHHFGLQRIDKATGIISKEATRGGNWVGGQINAGDVLIFRDLTVHAASPNTSGQLRISMDFRFQNYNDQAINPANLVFPGSNGRSWESTYANWRSDNLKYFWKKLPLTLKPTEDELAELVETEESPRMRKRYARILEQLQSQLPATAAVNGSYD